MIEKSCIRCRAFVAGVAFVAKLAGLASVASVSYLLKPYHCPAHDLHMARIYKRGCSPYYTLEFRYQGRVYRRCLRVRDKRSAEILLREAELSLAMGELPRMFKPGGLSFQELMEEVLPTIKRTWKRFNKETARVRRLSESLGGLKAKDLNTKEIERYISERFKDGASPSLVAHDLRLLKRILNLALEMGLIDKVPRFRMPKEPPGRIRYLEPAELSALLSACRESRSPYLYRAVLIALYTGMRKGEIMALRWDELDFANGFILVRNSKNGRPRMIPMAMELREYLLSIEDRKGLVVPGEFSGAFARATRRAGITDFRFHDLRHHFASYLVMSGVDIRTVAELLGHRTLAMVMRYSHLRPDHLAKAVSAYAGTISAALREVPGVARGE